MIGRPTPCTATTPGTANKSRGSGRFVSLLSLVILKGTEGSLITADVITDQLILRWIVQRGLFSNRRLAIQITQMRDNGGKRASN